MVALEDAILNDWDYDEMMKEYYFRYPDRGYGGFFHRWVRLNDSKPDNSWGNVLP